VLRELCGDDFRVRQQAEGAAAFWRAQEREQHVLAAHLLVAQLDGLEVAPLKHVLSAPRKERPVETFSGRVADALADRAADRFEGEAKCLECFSRGSRAVWMKERKEQVLIADPIVPKLPALVPSQTHDGEH